jgi:hypothetical protein
MTDLIKVPSVLGRYTLSWRWDCEQVCCCMPPLFSPVSVAMSSLPVLVSRECMCAPQTPQVLNSCADVVIV